MTFDDRGRLWITESVEYPRADEGAGRDTVKILDRFDENGRATRIRTFVDDLNIPSGIAVGHGGVWVLSAPDLLFFREENGRAVSREVIVTGFGRTDRHEVPNSLVWGPDGWLYGLNGVFNRSRVVSGDKTFDFTCALYRIHPRTREFRIVSEGTSNPWGLIFERDGQAIISACHWAKDHIFHFVETARYQRQAGPQPAWAWPLGSASDHGHQKTAYCGLAWLSSDEFPPPWRDRIVLGNVHGGAINSDILERDGSTFLSRKAPDLLNANDVWFMPVAQAIGPDGCLWVLDWYDRYHCYQDANRDPEGIDRARGRIWRIRHGDAPAMPTFDLANESDESLVGRLGSPNVLFRERAQRVLAERGTSSARDALERLVRDPHADRRARLHGLWSLIGMGPLPAELHRDLLVSPDSTFRAWAVRAAGEMGEVDSSARERVIALAFDASPDVRLEVAIAARKLRGIDPLVVLVDALSAGEIDRFLPAIAWEGLHDLIACHPTQFVARVAQADLARSPALASILPRAIERLLSEDALDPWSVARLLEKILQGHDDLLVRALGTIAERVPLLSEERSSTCVKALRPAILALAAREDGGIASSTARLLGGRLGIVSLDIDSVFATLADAKLSEDLRVRSLEALVAIEAEGTAAAAAKAIDHASAELAPRLVAALGRLDDSSAMEVLLARVDKLQGEARETALDLLVERQRWARRLLDRVLEGKLPKDTLRPEHLRRILDG
ncbi:MAG TPA: PVC-type heme-binding CxxCH protein, partial [Planctomycetota bacterium]|nr:PVC-type heme-binding CxxCH protein [Planctomycetota bacterium]